MKLAKDLRLELGFEPVDAARETGMSIAQWLALENKTDDPRLATVKKLWKLAKRAKWSPSKYAKAIGLE